MVKFIFDNFAKFWCKTKRILFFTPLLFFNNFFIIPLLLKMLSIFFSTFEIRFHSCFHRLIFLKKPVCCLRTFFSQNLARWRGCRISGGYKFWMQFRSNTNSVYFWNRRDLIVLTARFWNKLYQIRSKSKQ